MSILSKGLESQGRYYGTYVGYVKVVDPEDSRILLYIPEVFGPSSNGYMWALPKVYGGPNYGFQNLPEDGDAVWVTFRFGDYAYPIWEHGFYAKGEKPEEFKDIKVKGLITPDGTKVLINGSIITAYNKEQYGITINDSKVILGKEDAEKEPAVLGDTNVDLMQELVDLIQSMVLSTPAGDTIEMLHPTISQWIAFKEKLNKMKSKSVTLD